MRTSGMYYYSAQTHKCTEIAAHFSRLKKAITKQSVTVAENHGEMLKFLTHKLRTHSINENHCDKEDEDRDSGTESDEEIEESELHCERMCSVSPADTGCSMSSPTHDPHSSEEELEVINSNKCHHHHQHNDTCKPTSLRAASVCLPEKRKWSQMHKYSPEENEENMSHYGNLSPHLPSSPYKCHSSGEDGGLVGMATHSGSSDEEVHNLLASMATPVQFRTSPPLEAVKPGGGGGRRTPLAKGSSTSPPPTKILHYEVSPRKRSRHTRHAHVQRPYLDFEKMQHQKARSVRMWRHTGDHGGELSVFCW